MKQTIHSDHAPQAIGPYSQAVKFNNLVFLSGQIPLIPATMQLADGIDAQIIQVFDNLAAVAQAAGGSLANVLRLTIYLTDLHHFPQVNEIMSRYFSEPYPARVTIGVAALPKNSLIEIDAIMGLE